MIPALFYCIALLFAVITIGSLNQVWFLISDFDEKRILELLLIGLTLCTFFFSKINPEKRVGDQKSKFSFLLFLLLACTFVSVIASPSTRYSLLELGHFLGLFYLALYASAHYKKYTNKFINGIMLISLIGALRYEIGFFAGFTASILGNIPLEWPQPFFNFSNVRFFNQYQLWTISLFTLGITHFRFKYSILNYLVMFAVVSWWTLLFASLGRGTILSLLIATLITQRVYRGLAFSFLRLQIFLAIAGLFIYLFLFRLLPCFYPEADKLGSSAFTATVFRYTTKDRLYLWEQALRMIQEHPFFGVGPMHYSWYSNPIAAHPHNSILQLAAEWGLPATFIALFFIGYGLYCWITKVNYVTLQNIPVDNQQLPIILFFTLTTNICYSLVDGVIVMPLSQIMMAVVVGLMLGFYSNHNDYSYFKFTFSPIFNHRFFAGVLLVTIMGCAWPDIWTRLNEDKQNIVLNSEITHPRFWLKGEINPSAAAF
jgi:putative inorganic carbon (HCO3(-)) transporter